MLNLSKKVQTGTLVAKRGDKYIRCGKRMRPVGVYTGPEFKTILTDNGMQNFSVPRGIIVRGPATVFVK